MYVENQRQVLGALLDLHQIIILREHPSVLWLKDGSINIFALHPLDDCLGHIHASLITEWEATAKARIQFQHTVRTISPLHNVGIQVANVPQCGTRTLAYLLSSTQCPGMILRPCVSRTFNLCSLSFASFLSLLGKVATTFTPGI